MKNIKYHAGILQALKIMGMLAISVYLVLNSVYLHSGKLVSPCSGDNGRGGVAGDTSLLGVEAAAEETAKEGTDMRKDLFCLAECLAMTGTEQPFTDFTEEVFFYEQEITGLNKIAPRAFASRTGEQKEAESVIPKATAASEQAGMAEVPAAAVTTKALPAQPAAVAQAPLQQGNNYDTVLNPYVLEVIKTYRIGEIRYPYLLNKDYNNYNGVTTTLTYKGKVLLKAHPSGNRASHCVGITFEVFFKAMQERNRRLGISPDDFNGMRWDNLFDMALHWFVASGNKRTNNIVIAAEKYGIGKRIASFEDVQAGDFIDFNRTNGTGHTVVFINWIRQGGRITGMRYWSSQGSTGGINYNEEYFSGSGGTMVRDPIYMVRILPVNEYKR